MKTGTLNNKTRNGMEIKSMLRQWLVHWLSKESTPIPRYQCDFKRLLVEIRPCDVLLVEGHSRASKLIKAVTQSIWSHSAIYIGRLKDIHDADLRERILQFYPAKENERLLIEPLLTRGTVISPLKKYRHHHLRLCRPRGLTQTDAQKIIRHVIDHLGLDYNLRQMFDLARFVIPLSILPRRWHSSLYAHTLGIPDKTICSSMIASAFSAVHYPILPIVRHEKFGDMRLYNRNNAVYLPKDFDTSPYFDILKYPYPALNGTAFYQQLPWDDQGIICNAENECFIVASPPLDSGAAAARDRSDEPTDIKQWIPATRTEATEVASNNP
ncbi:MAG: YiiX/YebB-like N1pC/P60 family cysteine hydrolase [Pseudomonadota bacterium]